MRRERKFGLTFSGSYCINPGCLRLLYVELMAEYDEAEKDMSDAPFGLYTCGGPALLMQSHLKREA